MSITLFYFVLKNSIFLHSALSSLIHVAHSYFSLQNTDSASHLLPVYGQFQREKELQALRQTLEEEIPNFITELIPYFELELSGKYQKWTKSKISKVSKKPIMQVIFIEVGCFFFNMFHINANKQKRQTDKYGYLCIVPAC